MQIAHGKSISKIIRQSQEQRKIQEAQLASRMKPYRPELTTGLLIFGAGLAVLVALAAISAIQSVDAHSLSDPNSIQGEHSHQPPINGRQQTSGRLLQQQQQQQQQANGGASSQNRCQSGWMWFNNKCWVTTQSRRDFIHAVDLCKKMYNSTLPTIHSDEENEFLRQNIELTNSPIWLYARHNHQYNKTRWLDKTPVNYTRWDAGQPSDKSSLVCIKTEDSWYMKKAEPVDGQTECVSFWEDAKWGTQVGCQVLLPVVCEKKLTPMSRQSLDGQNGTLTSQFEQQQMYNPVSGSTSISNGVNMLFGVYTLTVAVTSLEGMSSLFGLANLRQQITG